ncbi:ankyrin [Lojkania enalia]|uniref:Ankyrin n=1 Tax=Lojkania enalia TaxID=147567 RepID=A0A9P4NBJ2_9PLEO|nr:ankyrin [Didymosphaeria enalia]
MTKDWDIVRQDIKELSVDQKKSLQEVKAIMESKHKFRASTRAYRNKLKEWGYMRHKPRRGTRDRSTGEDAVGIEQERDGDSDDSAATEPVVALLEEAEILIPSRNPWEGLDTISRGIVIEMLGAVLDADSERLEQLVLKNPSYINDPVGNPFDAPNGAFFDHPAMLQCVILQHPNQTLFDIACGLPSGPVIWVLLSHGAKGTRHPLGTDLAFHNAIKNGRAFTVQTLINGGLSNVNGTPDCPWKPLLQAAFWNVPDVVRILLDKGALVDEPGPAQDGRGFKTGLQFALDRRATSSDSGVRERSLKIIKMLLEAGANIHTPNPDEEGLTPFETYLKPWQGDPHWIISFSPVEIECLELFLSKGANLQTSFTGFPCSAPSGNTFEHQVLWHSTPLSARGLLNHVDAAPMGNGSNILHEIVGFCPAAKRHPADTLRDIEVLLKRGADPNFADSNGLTPLRICIERCPAVDIVPRLRALLDGGANCELRDNSGAEPIFLAARTFSGPLLSQVMEVLISRYHGRHPRIFHETPTMWREGFFPIPREPTIRQVMWYSGQDGDFESSLQQMVPADVQATFRTAAFNVASRKFLDCVVRRVKTNPGARLGTNEKVEMHHIFTMRQNLGLPDYTFDQDFIASILIPAPAPAQTSEETYPEMQVSASLSQSNTLDISSACLGLNLPTPLPMDTPQTLTSTRRLSTSSASSDDSMASFFIPTTTYVRWPAKRMDNFRAGDMKKAQSRVLKFKCNSCKHEPLLTKKEYKKHENEHWHAMHCKEEGCKRRFCVAERG